MNLAEEQTPKSWRERESALRARKLLGVARPGWRTLRRTPRHVQCTPHDHRKFAQPNWSAGKQLQDARFAAGRRLPARAHAPLRPRKVKFEAAGKVSPAEPEPAAAIGQPECTQVVANNPSDADQLGFLARIGQKFSQTRHNKAVLPSSAVAIMAPITVAALAPPAAAIGLGVAHFTYLAADHAMSGDDGRLEDSYRDVARALAAAASASPTTAPLAVAICTVDIAATAVEQTGGMAKFYQRMCNLWHMSDPDTSGAQQEGDAGQGGARKQSDASGGDGSDPPGTGNSTGKDPPNTVNVNVSLNSNVGASEVVRTVLWCVGAALAVGLVALVTVKCVRAYREATRVINIIDRALVRVADGTTRAEVIAAAARRAPAAGRCLRGAVAEVVPAVRQINTENSLTFAMFWYRSRTQPVAVTVRQLNAGILDATAAAFNVPALNTRCVIL